MVGGSFNASQFYADVEGHPDDPGMRFAFEELSFYSDRLRILGTYPADPFRHGARIDIAK
jgi:prephenate dehydratase